MRHVLAKITAYLRAKIQSISIRHMPAKIGAYLGLIIRPDRVLKTLSSESHRLSTPNANPRNKQWIGATLISLILFGLQTLLAIGGSLLFNMGLPIISIVAFSVASAIVLYNTLFHIALIKQAILSFLESWRYTFGPYVEKNQTSINNFIAQAVRLLYSAMHTTGYLLATLGTIWTSLALFGIALPFAIPTISFMTVLTPIATAMIVFIAFIQMLFQESHLPPNPALFPPNPKAQQRKQARQRQRTLKAIKRLKQQRPIETTTKVNTADTAQDEVTRKRTKEQERRRKQVLQATLQRKPTRPSIEETPHPTASAAVAAADTCCTSNI